MCGHPMLCSTRDPFVVCGPQVDVTVQLSSIHTGNMMGLCGSNDGNKMNDLVGRDGKTYECELGDPVSLFVFWWCPQSLPN